MGRLGSKVILVAGGGSIGGGLARKFAEEGAAVVLGDVNLDNARAIVADIEKDGGKAVATHLDGADEASAKAAVGLAVKTYGALDGMHANFASFVDANDQVDVLGISVEAYNETMDVNARGYLFCTRAALPEILKRGGGSIVYTSSAAGHIGEPGRVAYGMSKAAVNALMRHVARRFGPEGVRANCIAPGLILNVLWDADTIAYLEPEKALRSIKRPGEPIDIAAMSALLMSDEGSFITGQVISVDGGRSMRP
jgi:NAD(P)-dependent dehydrogenase (short-subunit alcohol dehydrogenase family)